jgi:TfoX/Sxy family transcriptional regulator of competence genes
MKKILLFATLLLLTACQETLEDRCARECKEYTQKKCPVLVTNGVTLDSMTFDKSQLLMTYYYTVSGILDDAEALRENNASSLLLKELKNTAALKLYKDAGYSFRYVYHSSKEKGTRVLDTTFRKKDYQ